MLFQDTDANSKQAGAANREFSASDLGSCLMTLCWPLVGRNSDFVKAFQKDSCHPVRSRMLGMTQRWADKDYFRNERLLKVNCN